DALGQRRESVEVVIGEVGAVAVDALEGGNSAVVEFVETVVGQFLEGLGDDQIVGGLGGLVLIVHRLVGMCAEGMSLSDVERCSAHFFLLDCGFVPAALRASQEMQFHHSTAGPRSAVSLSRSVLLSFFSFFSFLSPVPIGTGER